MFVRQIGESAHRSPAKFRSRVRPLPPSGSGTERSTGKSGSLFREKPANTVPFEGAVCQPGEFFAQLQSWLITRVFHESLKSRASEVYFGQARILVADLKDVIRSKRALGRDKDLAVLNILDPPSGPCLACYYQRCSFVFWNESLPARPSCH